MIAAIYARKSNDQAGVAEEQKSVQRQIEQARAYAESKGWTVAEEHIYSDDAISGAEFANRPGFLRLMNSLKPKPAFQVLVMMEEARLGREAIETAYALKQLVTAGVRVFFYLEDRERTLDSPTDKIMLSLAAFADELEREKARQRTYDAMRRKARAGHVTGGRVFGYDNVEVLGPDGKRSHVERRINESEAAIVRRIFELSASGNGYTRIAKTLNAEGAPTPRPQQGRPAGWAPSSVKQILERRLYLGEVEWNKTQKRNAWGERRVSDRPESEWLRKEAPQLQIVSETQWDAVHGRLRGIRERLQHVNGGCPGRHARDIESQHLLSGFARCACGGSFHAMSRSHGKQRAFFYGCGAHHKRGRTVCDNGLVMRRETVDKAVLETIGGEVLRPAVVMAVVEGVLTELEPENRDRDLERLRVEAAEAERAIQNLTRAIAVGGQLEPLLQELHARQRQRDELLTLLRAREGVQRQRFTRKAVERHVRACLRDWRALLSTHPQEGRQLLREVLAGPLRFTPDDRAYRFEGEAAIGRILAGVASVAPFVASPTGIEPVLLP